MKDFSYVMSSHPSYVDSLYDDYVKDPEGIDPEWKKFFEGVDFASSKGLNGNGQATAGTVTMDKSPVSNEHLAKELSVYRLINAYRKRGHLIADTNPIRPRKDRKPHLDLSDFGLTESDLNTEFYSGSFIKLGKAKLSDILARLKQLYAGDVGIEYTYINDLEKCAWVENAFEEMMQKQPDIKQKRRILEKLNEGVIFEKFLHTKYIGQKRFSLEGGESTIAALDAIIHRQCKGSGDRYGAPWPPQCTGEHHAQNLRTNFLRV